GKAIAARPAYPRLVGASIARQRRLTSPSEPTLTRPPPTAITPPNRHKAISREGQAMRSTGGDPHLLGHHSVLIYPFRHQLVGGARRSRLASLEPRWAHWASRFSESDLAAKLESTGFFFPYVRDLLYPEIGW